MSHGVIHDEQIRLQNPIFVDGSPGLGLVGTITTDHLIDEFEMTYFASIECPSLPPVIAYNKDTTAVLPPVRIYADEKRDLLALQSDVPVSPTRVADFGNCLSQLLADFNALPLYVSGLSWTGEKNANEERALYGIGTGNAEQILQRHAIEPPDEDGVWSGPTGALLNVARKAGMNALGLVVESDPEFPDPEAACLLIERVIEPIADITVNVEALRDQAEAIREEKKGFAEQMEYPEQDESSRAESLRMYQ
ncbi:proteasome assembly chaperone family protein [Halorussus sp. AFM4]|uniref:proteasome assembly chaperone family protein n=1 Tax=Halorussus sp. AFM4 TaxID=3421651 RepID=UPI003EC0E547